MLKRLIRHRLFVILIALLVALFIFAAPLRHDYFTKSVAKSCPVAGSSHVTCSLVYYEQVNVTEVHYGAPFGWLTLGKQTAVDTNKALDNYTEKNIKDFALDAGICLLCLVLILPMTKPISHTVPFFKRPQDRFPS